MNERLIHYSRVHVASVYSCEQQTEPGLKPHGLWLSVCGEYDWKWWCEKANYKLRDLLCPHDVVLVHDARILRLNGAYDIDKFTKKYSGAHPDLKHYKLIDWNVVANRYQGIIIVPYVWERRFSPFWYYGWDCASGCIWDKTAIESITSVVCQTQAQPA